MRQQAAPKQSKAARSSKPDRFKGDIIDADFFSDEDVEEYIYALNECFKHTALADESFEEMQKSIADGGTLELDDQIRVMRTYADKKWTDAILLKQAAMSESCAIWADDSGYIQAAEESEKEHLALLKMMQDEERALETGRAARKTQSGNLLVFEQVGNDAVRAWYVQPITFIVLRALSEAQAWVEVIFSREWGVECTAFDNPINVLKIQTTWGDYVDGCFAGGMDYLKKNCTNISDFKGNPKGFLSGKPIELHIESCHLDRLKKYKIIGATTI